MPIDPNIALGAKPIEMQDPLNQYAKVMQIQNIQQDNALNQLKYQESQRVHDYNIQRTQAEVAKAQAEQQKSEGEAFDNEKKRSAEALAMLPDTPEAMLKWNDWNHSSPIVQKHISATGMNSDELKSEFAQKVQDASTSPGGIRKLKDDLIAGLAKTDQMDIRNQDYADDQGKARTRVIGVNSYSGQMTPIENTEVAGKPTGPLVSVNTNDTASQSVAKEFGKTVVGTYNLLKTAPTLIQTIEDAKALIPGAKGYMGSSAGETLLNTVKVLNSQLGMGIDTGGVKDAEKLKAILTDGLVRNLKTTFGGRITNTELTTLKQAIGHLGTDPNALSDVLDHYENVIGSNIELFNKEKKSAEARGVIFPFEDLPMIEKSTKQSGTPVEKSSAASTGEVPSGWDPETWRYVPEDQKAAILAKRKTK